jgi:hypothetical protein
MIEINTHTANNFERYGVELYDGRLKTKTSLDEHEYLMKLMKYDDEAYQARQKKIVGRLEYLHRVWKLDLEKVKNLPDDILFEIKSYIQPELQYTKKFVILRQVFENNYCKHQLRRYLFSVPKKLIVKLIDSCSIYLTNEGGHTRLLWKNQKDDWTDAIWGKLWELFTDTEEVSVSSLIERKQSWESEHKQNKYYKLFLAFHTFIRYKILLQGKIAKAETAIVKLNYNTIKI